MSKENITQRMINKWYKQIIYCMKCVGKLNNWEMEFISSIYKQFNKYNKLSIYQSFKLNEIYNKH